MTFITLRDPYQTDKYGNTRSALLCAENFTQDDAIRLKSTVVDCLFEDKPEDETFDEFVERVVKTHNQKYGTELGIVFPSYEIDI